MRVKNIFNPRNTMSEKQELSQEEKIDYIYLHIKKEERNTRNRRIIKVILWLLLVGYFYIAIFVMLPKMLGNVIPWVDMASIKDTLFWNTRNSEVPKEDFPNNDMNSMDKVREILENNY